MADRPCPKDAWRARETHAKLRVHEDGHPCRLTGDVARGTVDLHERQRDDWQVHLIDTGLETQIGGRLKRLEPQLRDGTFMLTYGDGVCDLDMRTLGRVPPQSRKAGDRHSGSPACALRGSQLQGKLVAELNEKPQSEEGWINGGFFVLEPDVAEDSHTADIRRQLYRPASV